MWPWTQPDVHFRLGAEKVYIVYRRSEEELPARREEVENAKEEGIIFKFLTNPKQFIGNEQGIVKAMECYEMALGEPDASGRRRPIVKPGSEFMMEVDVVIVALGTTPNPLIAATTEGLQTTNHGTVVTDEATGKTQKRQGLGRRRYRYRIGNRDQRYGSRQESFRGYRQILKS